MLESIGFWGQIGAGAVIVLLGLSWLYTKVIKSTIPTGSTAETILDKASAYVDQGAAWTALQTVALLFKKHGDTESAETTVGLITKVLLWDDEKKEAGK